MRREKFKKAPILLGSNKDEGMYFVLYSFYQEFPRLVESLNITHETLKRLIKDAYPLSNHLQRKAIEFEYTNWLNIEDSDKNAMAVDRYTGDWQFTCPVVDFAHRYAETGNNVYMYYFSQQASVSPWPKWSGAMHADEITFLFGHPLKLDEGYTEEEKELSRQMMAYWANFAKTGNPSLTADSTWTSTYWPLHTPLKRETLTLHASDSTVLEGHGSRKCAFWKKYLPTLGNGFFDGKGGDFFPNYRGGDFNQGENTWIKPNGPKPCELECCNRGHFNG